MAEPKKLSEILKLLFGNDLIEVKKPTSPEEFMQGQEYSKAEESGMDEYGNIFTKTTYISKDGKRTYIRKVMNAKSPKRDKSMKQRNRLYTLEQELPNAIANEEFEKAVLIRDEIAKLKKQLKIGK